MRSLTYTKQHLINAEWFNIEGIFYVKANPLHWNEDGILVIVRDCSDEEKIKELDSKKTKETKFPGRPNFRPTVRKKEQQMKIRVAKRGENSVKIEVGEEKGGEGGEGAK